MLHDVGLHDVIGEHQAYVQRFMAHRILLLAKTTRGSRDARTLRARQDYKLASRKWRQILFEISPKKALKFF